MTDSHHDNLMQRSTPKKDYPTYPCDAFAVDTLDWSDGKDRGIGLDDLQEAE